MLGIERLHERQLRQTVSDHTHAQTHTHTAIGTTTKIQHIHCPARTSPLRLYFWLLYKCLMNAFVRDSDWKYCVVHSVSYGVIHRTLFEYSLICPFGTPDLSMSWILPTNASCGTFPLPFNPFAPSVGQRSNVLHMSVCVCVCAHTIDYKKHFCILFLFFLGQRTQPAWMNIFNIKELCFFVNRQCGRVCVFVCDVRIWHARCWYTKLTWNLCCVFVCMSCSFYKFSENKSSR